MDTSFTFTLILLAHRAALTYLLFDNPFACINSWADLSGAFYRFVLKIKKVQNVLQPLLITSYDRYKTGSVYSLFPYVEESVFYGFTKVLRNSVSEQSIFMLKVSKLSEVCHLDFAIITSSDHSQGICFNTRSHLSLSRIQTPQSPSYIYRTYTFEPKSTATNIFFL